MTRKDYAVIANTFSREIDIAVGNMEPHGVLAMTELAKTLAHDLARANSNFDPTKFLAACGISN